MSYVIRNKKGLYIKLDDNGSPAICSKTQARIFEQSKAINICNNLPNRFKKFQFKVEFVSDFKANCSDDQKEPTVLINENYELPKEITVWRDRANNFIDFQKDAKRRETELKIALSNVDKELSNFSHEVRFQKPLDATHGYYIYREYKGLVDKRGDIKDELRVVSTIVHTKQEEFSIEIVDKVIEQLQTRAFSYRKMIDTGRG